MTKQEFNRMNKLEEIIKEVEDWGISKNIVGIQNILAQSDKIEEEVGEHKTEIEKKDLEKAKLELGDVAVTVVLQAKNLGVTLAEILQMAHDKNIRRKGKTIATERGSTYVKEEDLKPHKPNQSEIEGFFEGYRDEI